MEEKHINTILKCLIILIIFLSGSAFGAYYADNNTKNDILKASNHTDKPTYLSFNLDGLVYYFDVHQITSMNYRDYVNVSLINDSMNETITKR